MPARPSGRPKATDPKDVRVTVRLTEHEAQQLERMAGGLSLSATLRLCLTQALHQRRRSGDSLPDTARATVRRERRKARRSDTPEAAALETLFTLDEPADADEPSPDETTLVQVRDEATGRTGTVPVTTRMLT